VGRWTLRPDFGGDREFGVDGGAVGVLCSVNITFRGKPYALPREEWEGRGVEGLEVV
jgi:hypothetical protein